MINREVVQLVRMLHLGCSGRRFESGFPYQETILHRGVEKLVSRLSHKQEVALSGSSPASATMKKKGSLAELVYCTGLENQRALTASQGFESLSFREM